MDFQSGDLTQGNITKKLIVFAIPFMLANFVQALYGTVDTMVIGWWGSASGIAAISTGSQVIQMLTSLVSGLTMGGTILIGQYCGAKRTEDTSKTIGTTLTMFGIVSIAFTIIMLVANRGILTLLQTPAEAFKEAYDYVFICSLGIIFIFIYNAISSILRGLGDSKSPLIFVAVACIVNIVLDIAFVGGLKMGAAGAALATVIAQAVSVLLSVVFLVRRKFIFDFKLKSFRIDRAKAARIIRLGLPVSLQETMSSLSFLLIAAIVNSLGVVTAAAVGISNKFEGYAMLPATAFCMAISSMTAQNMGAGKPERSMKCFKIGTAIAFGFGVLFFIWGQLAPESIMYIFGADAEVAAAGAQYLHSFSIDFMMVAFAFCMNGFFNGCGSTTFTMINGLSAALIVRVPLAFFLSRIIPDSLFGIGLAAPAASVFSIILGAIYLRTGRWKNQNIIDG